MAQPTLFQYGGSDFTDTGNTETTASFTWQSGDIFHIFGGTEDNTTSLLNVPSTTGSNLTFSQITATNTGSNGKAYYWRGTATGAGNGTITATRADGGTQARGIAVWQYRDSDGQGTPQTIVGSAAKVISVTRGQTNSHVIGILIDWNQVGDVVTDPTPSTNANERVAVAVSGRADFFVNDWGDQGSTGTDSYGITNHTGTVKMTGIAVEIFGSASGSNTIAVPAASLTLDAKVPVVTATANNSIAVPLATISLDAKTPTVTATAGQTISVPLASLTLDALAPTVSTTANNLISVPLATIELNTFAPLVQAGGNQSVSVPLATLSLDAYAPTVTASAHQSIAVPVASITLDGNAPTISVSAHNLIAVPAASITLDALAPTVTATANNAISVPFASLTLDAFAPTIDTGGPQVINVPLASMTLDAYAPMVISIGDSGGGGPDKSDSRDFEYWLMRARAELKRQAEQRQAIREQVEAIPDKTDREIATLLKKQEAKDQERKELASLQRFADVAKTEKLAPTPEMQLLVERAATARTNTALLNLQRELARMDEEEEALALALATILFQ